MGPQIGCRVDQRAVEIEHDGSKRRRQWLHSAWLDDRDSAWLDGRDSAWLNGCASLNTPQLSDRKVGLPAGVRMA